MIPSYRRALATIALPIWHRYNLSPVAQAMAWRNCDESPDQAMRCYRAIAASLRPHNPVTPSIARKVNAT